MTGPDCVLQLDKIMCDLTCTWTKRLVTWLVFGPNDLWLDLTSDQMTCDLTWRLTKWLVTWLGLARKWLVTWLGLAGKWLVTWLGLAKNDLLPSLIFACVNHYLYNLLCFRKHVPDMIFFARTSSSLQRTWTSMLGKINKFNSKNQAGLFIKITSHLGRWIV